MAHGSRKEAERIEQVKQNRHAQKLNDILLLGLYDFSGTVRMWAIWDFTNEDFTSTGGHQWTVGEFLSP